MYTHQLYKKKSCTKDGSRGLRILNNFSLNVALFHTPLFFKFLFAPPLDLSFGDSAFSSLLFVTVTNDSAFPHSQILDPPLFYAFH